MSSRYYMPSAGTAPAITPAPGAVWDQTAELTRRPLVATPSDTAIIAANAVGHYIAESSATSPWDVLIRQYISDPIGPQSISGTFSFVAKALESAGTNDMFVQLRIAVVSGDGTVERGELYAGNTATTLGGAGTSSHEMSSGGTRVYPAVALTSVTAQNGDRLLVEVGYRALNVVGTARQGGVEQGDPASGTDYALASDTGTGNRPWIEFSQTIAPEESGPPPPPPPPPPDGATGTFPTQDDLRLEIEDDPTGLVNLVQNPSGELGGWGWITPLASSTMGKTNDSPPDLHYERTVAGASYFTTEDLEVTAGEYVAAYWALSWSLIYIRARFEFYDAAGVLLSSGSQGGYLTGATTGSLPPTVAPASTARVRLRFDVYADTSAGNPAGSHEVFLRDATVAKAATSGELGTLRTNLVTNPSFETNLTDWVAGDSNAQLVRTTAQAAVGTYSLGLSSQAAGGTSALFPGGAVYIPVTGSLDYTLQARVRAHAAGNVGQCRMWFTWYRADNTFITRTYGDYFTSTTAWQTVSLIATAPSDAAKCKISIYSDSGQDDINHYWDAFMVEQASSAGSYFDGSTASGGGITYGWTGTAHASTSTAGTADLTYVEPVPYVNILGPTSELRIERDELNVSTLNATVWDEVLDPAVDDLIRPGRRIRLLVLVDELWETLFSGRTLAASTKYDLAQTRSSRRATISVSAVDNAAALAQASRPEGVATIAELPHVLEGAGVPWNVNGSGNQGAGAVVTRNESATAIDQVAITRDSQLGYAWVDRFGVVNVWDRAVIDNASVVTFNEDHYSDLDVSFDVDRCINEVRITHLRVNLATGETVEVPYGPYQDPASIAEWGTYSAEFRVQGLTDDDATMSALADEIFAANAQPQVRVNSAVVPIRSPENLTVKALLDLYDLVTITNTSKGISQSARVTKLSHEIRPGSWLVTMGFSAEGGVAAPQVTPPVQNGTPAADAGHPLRKLSAAGGQSITNATWTNVSLGNYTGGDSGLYSRGDIDAVSSSVLIEVSGWYLCTATLQFNTNGTGRRLYRIEAVSSTGAAAATGEAIASAEIPSTAFASQSLAGIVYLLAGKYVRLNVYQSSGAALTLTGLQLLTVSYLP